MRIHNNIEMSLKKETQIKIYELTINDLQEQFADFKANKQALPYKEYRQKYVYIHNRIQWFKRQLKALQGGN